MLLYFGGLIRYCPTDLFFNVYEKLCFNKLEFEHE